MKRHETKKQSPLSPDGSEPTRDEDTAPSLEVPDLNPFLLIIHGEDRGKRHRLYKGSTTLGRGREADIPIRDLHTSVIHCALYIRDGQMRIEDRGSRNGTFVNGERVETAPIDPSSIIQIGRTLMRVLFRDDVELEMEGELFQAATTDPLTGSPNRRLFMEQAHVELAAAKRHTHALALTMWDIDHFKQVNDQWGHAAGDHVLIHVARALMAQKRVEDLFCRYGGEEFLILLRETPRDEALTFAQRIRVKMEESAVVHESRPIPVTLSAGVSFLRPDDTLETLIQRADKALYRAKNQGRNRVEAEG